jgi:hypothetical protein
MLANKAVILQSDSPALAPVLVDLERAGEAICAAVRSMRRAAQIDPPCTILGASPEMNGVPIALTERVG